MFLEEHASIPGAVLSTTARDPVDRWYSQYRFEHLEHRDGSQSGDTRTPMVKWYKNQRGWTMGENYYIKTFIGDKDKVVPTNANGDFYWTYHKYHMKKLTWQQFEKAIINIRKFHVILITEWLNTSMPVITRVLDWKVPPRQVLPHEVQAVREQKKSLTAKQILSVEDFQYLVYDNVLDLLFFQIMKRIYLERLFCRK